MLETERLLLKPLTYEQLVKYSKADNSLEMELNLEKTARTLSVELIEALRQTILPNVTDPTKNYLYSTLWTVISKKDRTMVGDICIVGEPNAAGEIEIGYGTYEAFRGRGFMTEAVGALLKWTQTQPNVVSVMASTKKDNIASMVILKKNNFSKVGETEGLINWRLVVRKGPAL